MGPFSIVSCPCGSGRTGPHLHLEDEVELRQEVCTNEKISTNQFTLRIVAC